MEFKKVSFKDAVKLNDIIFINYIAKINDTSLLKKLLEEIERAFDLLQQAAIDFEEGVIERVKYICDWIKKELNWKENLSKTLVLFYELKNILPAFVLIDGQPFNLRISHPAEIGVIKHEEGEKDGLLRFDHGTASYLDFTNADTTKPYEFPVTNLIKLAANDLRLAKDDREFIQKLIS